MTLTAKQATRLNEKLARGQIRRAKIAVPVPVPPTNAWVIGGANPVMVDCGPLWADATERLAAAVGPGARLSMLLITHGHPDHHGAAAAMVRAHACAVLAHPFDLPAVQTYGAALQQRFETWGRAARENGMPPAMVEKLAQHYKVLGELGEDVPQATAMEDGAKISAGDLELEVFHLPGHTAGSVAFLARREGLLFSGDTVLPGITPNPFFEGLFDRASGPAPFLESIQRLRALPVEFVLPGHGEPMGELNAVLDSYERHHRERRTAIVEVLASRGAASGFEVVEALFPGASLLDHWLAMAEVLGHLQHLQALGEAEPSSHHGARVWRATA